MTDLVLDIRRIGGVHDIRNAGLRQVYELWSNLGEKGLAFTPADLVAIPDQVDRCALFEVDDQKTPQSATMSFCGSFLHIMPGSEMTNRCVSDLEAFPNAQRILVDAILTVEPLVLGPHMIEFSTHSYKEIEQIALPITDAQGCLKTILYVMHSEIPE